MKQAFAAVLVLILLFSGSMLHINALRKMTEEITAQIHETVDSCHSENPKTAEISLQKARDHWTDNTVYAHIFLHHDTIDGIEETFREAFFALSEEAYTQAVSACETLSSRFNRLLQDEQLCLKSIF